MDRCKMISVIDPKTNEPKMKKLREKHLTFRNSYSFIPAPLCVFDDIFNLKVHKDIISYQIYTEKNLQNSLISELQTVLEL